VRQKNQRPLPVSGRNALEWNSSAGAVENFAHHRAQPVSKTLTFTNIPQHTLDKEKLTDSLGMGGFSGSRGFARLALFLQ
jgi:hypothetical protein